MTPPVINDGIARWDTGQRHAVRITDKKGDLLDWFPIPLPGQRPGLATLWHTGWHPYPGSQWAEEPPGSWSCPVFRHSINGQRQ